MWLDKMVDWKTFKGSKVWPDNFIEQKEKLGYLNNPRWTKTPAHLDKHNPCGHWHKGPVSNTQIEEFYDWSWQPGVDIYANTIALTPQRWESGGPVDGFIGLVYNIPTKRWLYRGRYPCLPLYSEPYCTRISGDFVYVYGSIWNYDWYGEPGDPEYDKYYLALIRFQKGNPNPSRVNVFESNYTHYDFSEYPFENAMDAMGSRVVCAVKRYDLNGLPYNKYVVRISDDYGASFSKEWVFPDLLTTLTEGSYEDYVQVRMDSGGTCYLLYTRSSHTSSHRIELWKSNADCTDFTKKWEFDYYASLQNHVCNGSHILFDVSESGSYITAIPEWSRSSPEETYFVVCRSEDGGETLLSTNWHVDNYSFGSCGKSDGEHAVIPVSSSSTYFYALTDDFFMNLTYRLAPYGVSGYFVDMQRYYNKYVYTECGESFTPGVERQGLLYSDNYGQSWTPIVCPASVSGGVLSIFELDIDYTEPQDWEV